MVNRLCAALGDPLPHPAHFSVANVHTSAKTIPSDPPSDTPTNSDLSLFSFPPPTALAQGSATESLLRQLGFGYRANFIPWSAAHLLETAQALKLSPDQYLRSLTRSEFTRGEGLVKEEDDTKPDVKPDPAAAATTPRDDEPDLRGIRAAREKLLDFKGVGRKVADCILLFGLGWSETVPVDTHVFQIAIRDYGFPATKNASLSPALHDRVSEFLASKWGAHAGWAQQILFFADLKPAASASPTKAGRSAATNGDGTRRMTVKVEVEEELSGSDADDSDAVEQVRKLTFDEEVAALIANPGAKRRRSSAAVAQVAVERVKAEEDGSGDEDQAPKLRVKEEVPISEAPAGAAASSPARKTRPPLKQRRTTSTGSVTSARQSRSRSSTIKSEAA